MIRRIIFPAFVIAIGLSFLIFSFVSGQNGFFIIGSLAIVLIGVVAFLNAMDMVEKMVKQVIIGALVVVAVVLVALDYKSIKDPLEFKEEKNRRYAYVIQRLKDIRKAQIAYKSVKGVYAADFDSLLSFIRLDSFPVVKSFGNVPDSLTEQEAIELQIVTKDTVLVSVKDSIFHPRHLKNRKGKFYLDSLAYVPFTSGAKFELKADEIIRNNVPVQVFEVTDGQPYDPKLVLKVGSLTEPTTSGNWGE